jgi:hypothetical protein
MKILCRFLPHKWGAWQERKKFRVSKCERCGKQMRRMIVREEGNDDRLDKTATDA